MKSLVIYALGLNPHMHKHSIAIYRAVRLLKQLQLLVIVASQSQLCD